MRSVDMNSDIGSLRRNITEQIFDLRGRTVTKFGKKTCVFVENSKAYLLFFMKIKEKIHSLSLVETCRYKVSENHGSPFTSCCHVHLKSALRVGKFSQAQENSFKWITTRFKVVFKTVLILEVFLFKTPRS